MERELCLYLSGSIRKGQEDHKKSFWSADDLSTLKEKLLPIKAIFLNPALRSDDLSDFSSTFGRDLLQVLCSDLVIVDARDRRGIGIGAEMAYAKINNIPVIAIAPRGTHYHRENFMFMNQHLNTWVHPFVFGLSDQVVASVEAAAEWIVSTYLSGTVSIKGPDCFNDAVMNYLSKQLENDHPMKELVSTHESIREKVSKLLKVF